MKSSLEQNSGGCSLLPRIESPRKEIDYESVLRSIVGGLTFAQKLYRFNTLSRDLSESQVVADQTII